MFSVPSRHGQVDVVAVVAAADRSSCLGRMIFEAWVVVACAGLFSGLAHLRSPGVRHGVRGCWLERSPFGFWRAVAGPSHNPGRCLYLRFLGLARRGYP